MDDVSIEEIHTIIENKQTGILYFYTPLCGTCQVAGKMLSVVELMLPQIPFLQSDLNYIPEAAELFKIESVPCLIVMVDGEMKEKIYAFQSVPYLHSIISQYC